MNNSTGVIRNQPAGKQLINAILNLKSENQHYRCLNKLKDDLIRKKIEYAEEVKKEIISTEYNFQANEQLISDQKMVIDDLTQKVDYLNNQLSMTKSSVEGNSKLMDTHQDTIQGLAYKLKEAEKYIDDQNYVIDQLKQRLSDNKNEFENSKRGLRERYLERLEKAKQEIEEEREKMAKKLKQTRDFYDAEGRDYKRQINQLTEQLDLLRSADFSRPDQSTSRGRGRKRPTSTTKRGGGVGRGRGRPATKKSRISEVDSSVNFDDDDDFSVMTPKKKTVEADCSAFAEPETNRDSERSQSLSPMEWRTPRGYNNEQMDDDEDDN